MIFQFFCWVVECRTNFVDGAGLLCIRRVVNFKLKMRVVRQPHGCGHDKHLKDIWPFRVSLSLDFEKVFLAHLLFSGLW